MSALNARAITAILDVNDELRKEIASLKATLAACRAELAQTKQTSMSWALTANAADGGCGRGISEKVFVETLALLRKGDVSAAYFTAICQYGQARRAAAAPSRAVAS